MFPFRRRTKFRRALARVKAKFGKRRDTKDIAALAVELTANTGKFARECKAREDAHERKDNTEGNQ